jgi:hypothetical protein
MKNVNNFFVSIEQILPCEKCKNNYKKHLLKYPLSDKILRSKKNLVMWLINIHNEVNKQNGKKIYTYEEVYKIYMQENEGKYNILLIANIVLLVMLIIILVILFLNK